MLQEFQTLREDLNQRYVVGIRFVDRVVGGIPAVSEENPDKSRDILRVWLRKRLGEKLTEEELEQEVNRTFEEAYTEKAQESSTTFKADEQGLYLEGRQVKALIKEAAGRLGFNRAVPKERPSLRQDIHEGCHVDEDRVYLMRAGAHVTQPDGYETRAMHVMGPQGPRNCIKKAAFVTNGECEFTVRMLNALKFSVKELKESLAFAQDLGLGADRSQGFGKFEVVSFEAV